MNTLCDKISFVLTTQTNSFRQRDWKYIALGVSNEWNLFNLIFGNAIYFIQFTRRSVDSNCVISIIAVHELCIRIQSCLFHLYLLLPLNKSVICVIVSVCARLCFCTFIYTISVSILSLTRKAKERKKNCDHIIKFKTNDSRDFVMRVWKIKSCTFLWCD